MSNTSQVPDESISVESDSESITTLRDLVEKLSTAEGKTISWKALSKLVQLQDSCIDETLDECLTDGRRIIRVSFSEKEVLTKIYIGG